MDRRTFMGTVGAGLVGGLAVPAVAAAGPPRAIAEPGGREDRRVHRILDQALSRRDAALERLTARYGEAPMPAELRLHWIRATAAITGIEALSRLTPRDQIHAHAQGVIIELVEDVARGAHAVRELLAAVDVSRVDAHESLHAAMDEVEAWTRQDQDPTEAGRRVTAGTAAEVRAQLHAEGLAQVSARTRARLDRLVDLSERIAQTGRGAGLIASSDPAVAAQVEEGRAFWGPLAARDEPGAPGERALLILGIIVSGLAIVFAGYVLLVTVACAISCEAPGLFSIALVAGVVIVLLVAGIVAMGRRLSVRRRARRPPPEPTRGKPADDAAALCVLFDVPTPGPRCDRITMAVAAAYGRGIPRSVVREYASYVPNIDLLPIVLSRLEPGRAWSPSPTLAEVRRMYARRQWTYLTEAFAEDVRAVERALDARRSLSDIRLATDLARRPGHLAELLDAEAQEGPGR